MNIDLSQLVTKETLQAQALEEEMMLARRWRDSELSRADVELNKVQDGVGKGSVGEWRTYRCKLRDWPSTDDFPVIKPIAPDA